MRKKLAQLILGLGIITAGAIYVRPALTQDAPNRIEITARRFLYEPSEITLKKGQPVVLIIRSLDAMHGLRFPDLNLNIMVDKNSSGEMKLTPDKIGNFVGHCSVFCGAGHRSMMLTLHVVD